MACDDKDCTLEMRIQALEKEAEHNAQTHQKFYDKLEIIGKEQVKTDTIYANILEKLGTLENKVDSLSDKPVRHWDSIITALITAVVAGIVAYFIGGAI